MIFRMSFGKDKELFDLIVHERHSRPKFVAQSRALKDPQDDFKGPIHDLKYCVFPRRLLS